MFRPLGVILRPSIEPNQDYLITKYMTRARLRIVPKTHHYISKVTCTEPTVILKTWE
jgi:hypothetical protein